MCTGRQVEDGSSLHVRPHQAPAQSPGSKAAAVIAEGGPAHTSIRSTWTQQPELKTNWNLGIFEPVSQVFQKGLQPHPGLALPQSCKAATH